MQVLTPYYQRGKSESRYSLGGALINLAGDTQGPELRCIEVVASHCVTFECHLALIRIICPQDSPRKQIYDWSVVSASRVVLAAEIA